MAIAGRGFGKTKLCAEDAWWYAAWNDGVRLAAVAPTNQDLRKTVMEGESGLLNSTPPQLLEGGPDRAYNKTTNELKFINGSLIQGFSSESYERLRGPQFHRAWCEELCLAAGTAIETDRGPKAIETIKAGDLVRTRNGSCRVVKSGMTNNQAEVYRVTTSDGRTLVGTEHHPVFVSGSGFIDLKLLRVGDILETWDMRRLLSGTAISGERIKAPATTGPTEQESYSTGRNIRRHTGLLLRTSTYTTETKIKTTTNCGTLKRFLEKSTTRNMVQKVGRGGLASNYRKQQISYGKTKKLRNTPVSSVTASLKASHSRSHGFVARNVRLHSIPSGSNSCVMAAARSSREGKRKRLIASTASSAGGAYQQCSTNAERIRLSVIQSRASCVDNCLSPTIAGRKPVAENADSCFVVSVERLPARCPVFNLEVEGEHEYYANGILTHNCAWPRLQETWDMLMFCLRLGQRPQVVISTTPKPFKLIKELKARKDFYKVAGSTYENKDNLAPTFLDVIEKQYAGTRIGRQEIMGEILDDILGALWTWEMIEGARYSGVCPDFSYITVNIDPSVGDGNPDNDECGITATGLGRDGFGYVLADRSLHGSPDEWVSASVKLYQDLNAHWIVAEANNGGKLIESAIHAVSPNIPVKLVHASQGKRTRAEPVALLYERRRIRHFGVFADLEMQLCDWSPELSKYSPGRMDSLVWGLTALMVDSPSDFFCFVA